MSLLLPRPTRTTPTADARALPAGTTSTVIPRRDTYGSTGTVYVDGDSALRMSAVWACLRLRANLEAQTPLDVFRRSGGVQMEMPKPALISSPGGPDWTLPGWIWARRVDLDRYGNAMGLISSRDGLGLARQVDLWDQKSASIITKGRTITGYRYDGVRYDPADVWHERQYRVAGLPMGLSPIAYAAWSIGAYLSAQEFALRWFTGGAFPSGVLKNVEESEIDPAVINDARRRFRMSAANGEPFVTGAEWEWTASTVDAQGAAFLDEMKYGIADISRFMDVPGDLIGAETSSGSITYANVSQRMVQLLVTSLGPMYVQSEAAWSAAVPARQYVKCNTDSLLRLDPETRSQVLNGQILVRRLAPSEARELDNRAPFTPEQVAEFETLDVPIANPPTKGVAK